MKKKSKKEIHLPIYLPNIFGIVTGNKQFLKPYLYVYITQHGSPEIVPIAHDGRPFLPLFNWHTGTSSQAKDLCIPAARKTSLSGNQTNISTNQINPQPFLLGATNGKTQREDKCAIQQRINHLRPQHLENGILFWEYLIS